MQTAQLTSFFLVIAGWVAMLGPLARRRKTIEVAAFDEMSGLTLVYRPRQLMRPVASKMATAQRKLMRAGRKPGGGAVTSPADGGRPLRRSGQLIRSIKGRPVLSRKSGAQAVVWASGTRDDLGASLKGRNAGLLAVQLFGRKSWAKRPRNPGLMAFAGPLPAVALAAFEAALARQLARGKARLEAGRPGQLTRRDLIVDGSAGGGLAGRLLGV